MRHLGHATVLLAAIAAATSCATADAPPSRSPVAIAGPRLSPEQFWEDLRARDEALVQQAPIVAAGRLVGRSDVANLGEVAEVQIERVLKGDLGKRRVLVRTRTRIDRFDRDFPSRVWFLAHEGEGRFVEMFPRTDGYAGMVRAFARTTRKPYRGLEPPDPPTRTSPIAVTLGLDLGTGRASRTPTVPVQAEEVLFIGQIANMGAESLFVTGPLDGSARRLAFPKIRLELERTDGKPLERTSLLWCGNVSGPAHRDVVSLEPKEALFFDMWTHAYRFVPGRYRARLHYESKRSLEGVTEPVPPAAEKAFMRVWEGAGVSDWVVFTVAPAPKAELQSDGGSRRR